MVVGVTKGHGKEAGVPDEPSEEEADDLPELVDAQEMHRLHPKTFDAPTPDDLLVLKVGDHVKICCGSERFWLEVLELTPDDKVGKVDNQLFFTSEHGYVYGDLIEFELRHIYDIMKADEENLEHRTDKVLA